MDNLVLILSMSVLMIFLSMVGSIWFMNFCMKAFIGKKHLVIEEIVATKKIPDSWSRKFDRKIIKVTQKGQHEKIEWIRQAAHQSYFRKLNQLVQYVKSTKLVQDEETRSVMLADLAGIHQRWEEGKRNASNSANQ